MNEQTDLNTVIQDNFINTMTRFMRMTLLDMMFTIMPQKKERLIEELGHELTQQNLDDCYQFIGERIHDPDCLERAKEREIIRRLIYGSTTDNL